jgi:hypothetical protein
MDDIRLKIKWAGKHRETFEREVMEFFSHDPARAVAQLKPDGSGYDIHLTEPLPAEWSCLLSNFAQDLRQAFDHFVWAAALRTNPKPPSELGFPIRKTEVLWNEYVATKAGWNLRAAVGEDAWKVIVQFQPHSRWRPDPNPDTDPLWGLNQMARFDRHQALHVAVAFQQGTISGFGLNLEGNVIRVGSGVAEDVPRFATATFQDDARLGHWSATSGGVETQVATYGQVFFEVVFDPEGRFNPNGWISRNLTALYQSVNTWCLPRMEAIFGPKLPERR